jgi:glycosyltransferase involved in cell wall biosynthesis
VGKTYEMKRRKILLIIPELGLGGAQRSMSKLSLELSKLHDVWLVVFNSHASPQYPIGGNLIDLEVETGSTIGIKVRAFRERVKKLRTIKKDLAIDVSISFLEGADYVNVLSKVQDKVIISVRGSKKHDDNITNKNFGRLRHLVLIPMLYKKADRIVAVNKGIADELAEVYKLKQPVEVIRNYYDLDGIRELAADGNKGSIDFPGDYPVIITTGRLSREKGLLQLLEVFYLLKKDLPTVRWVIVGDGPLRQDMVMRCQQLGLSVAASQLEQPNADVLMVGSQPNVFKYLRSADLYVMNSSNEGFPNGIAEAMICGVPVASSDCPYGPREILAPSLAFRQPIDYPYFCSGGVLLPIIRTGEDVGLWKMTLLRLLLNESKLKELSQAGLKRIQDFGDSEMVHHWNSIIESTISGKNPVAS